MNARSLMALTMGVTMALPLAAQTRDRTPSTRTRVFVNGDEVNPLEFLANRRARLGVVLDMKAIENDSIGATISSVTPGGPASKAGLRSGDIVTRINGQRLSGAERERRDRDRDKDRDRDFDRENESSAALRLIEVVAKLEPGDTVAVEYRRGKEAKTVSIETSKEHTLALRELGDGNFNFNLPKMRISGDDMASPQMFKLRDGGEPGDFMMFGGPFAELELAPINPELGAYFGTTEGVLVIDTPEKSSLGLKGGDVILSVDGRKARGPGSLLRILRSYENGDVLKIEIIRNKSRLTLSSKVDRDED